jgi:hypothetical protein
MDETGELEQKKYIYPILFFITVSLAIFSIIGKSSLSSEFPIYALIFSVLMVFSFYFLWKSLRLYDESLNLFFEKYGEYFGIICIVGVILLLSIKIGLLYSLLIILIFFIIYFITTKMVKKINRNNG